MKILIFADIHFTHKSPKIRKDNYFETLRNKLEWDLNLSWLLYFYGSSISWDFFDTRQQT
jgi:hypothetical protein